MAKASERQRKYRERKKQREQGKFRTVQVPVNLVPKLQGRPQLLVEYYAGGEEALQERIEARKEELLRATKQKLVIDLLRSFGVHASLVKDLRRPSRYRSKLSARVHGLESQLREAEEQEKFNGARKELLARNRFEADQWAEVVDRVCDGLTAFGSREAVDVLERIEEERGRLQFSRERCNEVIEINPWLVRNSHGK